MHKIIGNIILQFNKVKPSSNAPELIIPDLLIKEKPKFEKLKEKPNGASLDTKIKFLKKIGT